MNIVSALLRVVGRHRSAHADTAWWWSVNYATGDRRIYRHRESLFIYPPSRGHIRIGARDSARGEPDRENGRNAHGSLQMR